METVEEDNQQQGRWTHVTVAMSALLEDLKDHHGDNLFLWLLGVENNLMAHNE